MTPQALPLGSPVLLAIATHPRLTEHAQRVATLLVQRDQHEHHLAGQLGVSVARTVRPALVQLQALGIAQPIAGWAGGWGIRPDWRARYETPGPGLPPEIQRSVDPRLPPAGSDR